MKMVDIPRFSKIEIVFLFVGIGVTAFLGIVAGSYVIQQKTARATRLGANLRLKVGQVFPEYRFTKVDTKSLDFDQSRLGKKTVLIFLTTDCGFCKEAIGRWAAAYSDFRPEYQVVGISFEKIEILRDYQRKKNIPFPLFNDSLGKFTAEYKIDAFPTVVGLNENREIVFIDFGNHPGKDVREYLKLL